MFLLYLYIYIKAIVSVRYSNFAVNLVKTLTTTKIQTILRTKITAFCFLFFINDKNRMTNSCLSSLNLNAGILPNYQGLPHI